MRAFGTATGKADLRIVLAVAIVVASAGFAVARVSGLGGSLFATRAPGGNERADTAPEFTGIQSWINSEPLTIRRLRGDVVLVDFWTYSCVNCVRTIPGLRALYERYRPAGLEIVGVHSPEFNFEMNIDNVIQAVRNLKVSWPVAVDNRMETWRAFRNNYWPHVYLIDRTGVIRYDKIGEGDESELEAQVRKLLAEDAAVTLPPPVELPEPEFHPGLTPEIYAGYSRGEGNGTIANPEQYSPDQVVNYSAPQRKVIEDAFPDGRLFLDGAWIARPQFLEARSAGRVILPFFARDVFVVASSQPATRLRAILDGKALASPGASVRNATAMIDRSDLYHLVRLPKAGEHVLVLEVEKGFRLFTFTFG